VQKKKAVREIGWAINDNEDIIKPFQGQQNVLSAAVAQFASIAYERTLDNENFEQAAFRFMHENDNGEFKERARSMVSLESVVSVYEALGKFRPDGDNAETHFPIVDASNDAELATTIRSFLTNLESMQFTGLLERYFVVVPALVKSLAAFEQILLLWRVEMARARFVFTRFVAFRWLLLTPFHLSPRKQDRDAQRQDPARD
jgi:hypothetical protein